MNTTWNLTETLKYKETWLWTWARASWLGRAVRESRRWRREFWAWTQCEKVAPAKVQQLAESIAAIPVRALDSADEKREAPIFLLSTGGRAGSTLLQRILVTDSRVLLWGEPLSQMGLISRITEAVSGSVDPHHMQQWRNSDKASSSSLPTSWINILFPPGDDFRSALRSLFDRWLGEPARELGYTRWGFKEVRLGAAEAILLQWLYPNAKFIILSRHPYDCYRSLVDSNWHVCWDRYTNTVMNSAVSFARIWNQMAVSWSQLPAGFPCVFIRYEDVVSGNFDFRKLESWLGIEIKEKVALSVSVGGTTKRSRLSWCERLIIDREATAGMHALGYSKHIDK
jgi:hypothetical protein